MYSESGSFKGELVSVVGLEMKRQALATRGWKVEPEGEY